MVHREICGFTSEHRRWLWRQFSDTGCQKDRAEDGLRSACLDQTLLPGAPSVQTYTGCTRFCTYTGSTVMPTGFSTPAVLVQEQFEVVLRLPLA